MSIEREERCYMCNKLVRKYKLRSGEQPPSDMRTRDHIPPDNLFPDGKRSDLITVICCHDCNKGFSKLDEQFRVFVTSASNVSEVGKVISRQKVFGGSFKKSPKLKKQMGRDVFIGTMVTELGAMSVPLIAMDREVLDGFFTRLTKGLLTMLYPDINHFTLRYGVVQLNQFGPNHPTFRAVTSILKSDQRGDGIFRFWHGVALEKRTTGIWIYQFYDASLFLVKHSEDVWPQTLPSEVLR